MKKHYVRQQSYFLLLLFFITSCSGQKTTSVPKAGLSESKTTEGVSEQKAIATEPIKIYGPASDPFIEGQVSQYIRRMHQDKNGNIWFGTNGDGVCRYDGTALTYFTPTEGFGGLAVRGIVEDASGNLWFATDGGVCRYDPSKANPLCNNNKCRHDQEVEQDLVIHNRELAKAFTQYTVRDGLSHNQVWSILLDKTGILWFGTEGGVSRFDGKTFFMRFPLPEPDLKAFPDAYPAPKLVNCMMQDKAGNIWFGTNGGGVYRFDGTALTNISEQDGLCNNFVQCIFEDKNGDFWFGSRFGGMSRYNGRSFTNFTTAEGLCSNFVWTFLEDKDGYLWIATAGGGTCRYDGKTFTGFSEKDGLTNKYIQSILEDHNGKLWFGASGGLFRFDGKSFINVRKTGPW